MKKGLILSLLLCLLTQMAVAQTPKWVEKTKKAVFSVVTYDKTDKILNTGNGFFVSDDGVALSDFTLFKDAKRAVIIDSDGKEMPVDCILGVSSLYDVVKFRVAITSRKVPALTLAEANPVVGEQVWMLPYSTQKSDWCTTGKVKQVTKIADKHQYYTLDMAMKEKMVSCPIVNAKGQVFGISQKSSGADAATVCYAVSVSFGVSLDIKALSVGDSNLRSIGIKKGLPDNEDQALVYLFMASTQFGGEEYLQLLNDFIKQFPNNSEAYLRRANYFIHTADENGSAFDKANSDMEEALKIAKKKDDVYFNISKTIYSYILSNPEKPYAKWNYDYALKLIKEAEAINPLPVYVQLEGDLLFAKQDYAAALSCYEKVNKSNLASPASYFSAAKTKELMKADVKEVLALMDSCIALCPHPMTADVAPYVLERAQVYVKTEQYRNALLDYDAYFSATNGQVNDLFYYYREQAAFKARQYQRALDDIAKAIELNPKEVLYQAEQAVVNMRVGRVDEAMKVLKGTIAMEPKYAEAYRLMGLCFIQQKKNKEACSQFAKAKELGDANVDELIKKYCDK